MKTQHTPLKAIGSYFDNAQGKTIGKIIEYKGTSLKDDAVKVAEASALCTHIVKCVNLHDELVSFLSIQVENTRGLYLMYPKNNDLRLRLLKEEDLLKRAKGGE